MKKRIFLALLLLIAVLSIGFVSAGEIDVNDTYAVQDSNTDFLAVDQGGVGSDNSNNLSINNVDTILDESIIGASEDSAKKAVTIDAPDVNLYYRNGTRFIATLSDVDGNKLANQTLLFTISGVDYARTTDVNGSASIAINLIPGTYDFITYYNGSDAYMSNKVTSKVTVYPTVSGNDIVKYYKNATQYYATFLNASGSPLANANVTFNINGVFYTRVTNASGVARLNINLPPNDYVLTAIHPDTGYMYSNNVTVLYTIYADNLTKVYRDSNQYYAEFVDGTGSPLANTNVTYNINGVFYTRMTNASGVARLNINLLEGTYVLTAYHPGDESRLSNTIKVLGTSETSITTSDYSYMIGDTQYIEATLYNELGYTVANQTIVINIGSTSNTAVTDANGKATIKANMPVGVYNVTYTYNGVAPYKSSSATGTLKIRDKYDTTFVVNNTVIYYNKKETFDVTVLTDNNVPVVNQPVYLSINGASYTRITDETGTARLTINLYPGVYDISYKFNSTKFKELTESSLLMVIDTNTSILSAQDTTVGEGAGEKFPILLTVDDFGMPYRDVIININGVNYTRTTNDFGVAEITINLAAGKYPVKYYYLGESRVEPSSGQAYITVKPRTATSMKWLSSTTFISGITADLKVSLVDSSNKPLASKDVVFTISSKEYPVKTDSSGIATLSRSLFSGTYVVTASFAGDGDYIQSEVSTVITVASAHDSSGYGYWVFGRDMENVNLSQLASLGTTDIFLNFYSLSLHGQSKVTSWIQSAKSYGINVHIWMQCFYDGEWLNPVSGGSINQALFNELIDEAKSYATIPGVAGVHLDYLRYPGNAYKTTGGTEAITEFVKQVTAACRAVNPSIIMSASIMPETTNDIYYYGQDISAISQYLDVIVLMQYKGNYNAGTDWLASTTRWYVQNSQGAEVWSGLQTYLSDENPTKLTYTELFGDAQTVVDNGADGVMLFRFGISNFLNFKDLEDPQYNDVLSLSDVLDAASELKLYIENNWTLPSKVYVGDGAYTVPQFLALMNQALLMIEGVYTGDIVSFLVAEPEKNRGDVIYDVLFDEEYLEINHVVYAYCVSNNQAPDNATSSVGDIKYETLVYMYSRILDFYATESVLPAFVLVNNFLDNPTLTVNMLPSYSTTDYQYVNYTTTWLNYCPICEHYGTLLINPKGTVEGELTCYYCDADFCGVTGHDKIIGSTYELVRLSESVPVSEGKVGDKIALSSIIDGASYLAGYFQEYLDFPDYIVLKEGKYSLQDFLYLMSRAIVQIDASNANPVTLIEIGGPSTPTGDMIDGTLSKTEYMDVVNRVANFISSNNWIPNYASSTLGRIAYAELLDSFSRILDYYYINDVLPTSVHITYKGSSSKSVSELAHSLVTGLTSDRDKAVALYNYVRDSISYSFYYNTQKGAEGTLVAGTGNCCDQAQLLVAMARAVGLTARFATGYCTFSSGSTYGHVWVQFNIDGSWINADPTSTRNSFGVINNWNTRSYTDRGTFDVLPY